MPGHWPSRLGGYALADLAGLSYHTATASQHAHTRCQVAALQLWVQNGRDARLEYGCEFEDTTWEGNTSVDVLVMPDQALNLPAVVIEVVATSYWCGSTNKYVHNTSAFYLALGQACRKRRVLDGAYAHLGLGLPPTDTFCW